MVLKIFRFKVKLIDISDGHTLSDAKISFLDAEGETINSFKKNINDIFDVPNYQNAISLKIKVPGYCEKLVSKSSLSFFKKTIIKLVPNAPVAYLEKAEFMSGEKVQVFVHSPQDYVLTIYRHGIKKINLLETSQTAIIQDIPDGDISASGLFWKNPIIFTIDSNWKAGMYSVELKDEDGRSFSTPLIINTSKANLKSSNILVIANLSTWQAYNVWGGRSRYRRFDENNFNFLPPLVNRLIMGIRRRILNLFNAMPVSGIKLEPSWISRRLANNRPLPNKWLQAHSPYNEYLDHLAAHEWRGLAWLESLGINYEYCSDNSKFLNKSNLKDFDCVVLLGHSEYWSKESYQTLYDSYFNDEISLIILGGNNFYHEVIYDDRGGMFCKHGSFAETFKDPSKLTKTTTDLSINDFAPYLVNKNYFNHWIFNDHKMEFNSRNDLLIGVDSLMNNQLIESESRYSPHSPGYGRKLIGGIGASGWEVEKIIDDVDKEYIVIAQGLNKGKGADMILRDKNNLIFLSVSSISFIGSLLIDKPSSKITQSVILRAIKYSKIKTEEKNYE